MRQISIIGILIWALIGIACDTETGKAAATHDIAFYTLQSLGTTTSDCQLDLTKAQEKEKIISNDEILSYHAAEHYFILTAAAINRLKAVKSQTPFYLKVDNELVYSGFLMPGYLSMGCFDIIVIDPLSYNNNMIWVRYDYASTSKPANDFRNNAALLAALQNQGKLEK